LIAYGGVVSLSLGAGGLYRVRHATIDYEDVLREHNTLTGAIADVVNVFRVRRTGSERANALRDGVGLLALLEACVPCGDKKYGRDAIADAVRAVLLEGYTYSAAGRLVGAQRQTVAAWMREVESRFWAAGVPWLKERE